MDSQFASREAAAGTHRARTIIQPLLALLLGVLMALPLTTPARAVAPHAISVSFQPTGTSCTEGLAKGPSTVASISADRATAIVVCAHVEDVTTATDQPLVPVELRVTVGTLGSSGTSKYSGLVFSSSAGVSQISYRGDGVSYGTDTIIATYEGGHAVAVASIEVTPPAGRVPAQLVVTTPPERAIAAADTRPGAGYVSPAPGAAMAVQVRDAAGLGVNAQPLLVTAEHGRVVANPAFAGATATLCAGATARAIVLTSSATDVLAPGGQAMPGTADFVVCPLPGAPPGAILVTIEAITQRLAAVTATIRTAGPPTAIGVTVERERLTARVTDAAGNPVADGTPVRFAIPPAAGVASATCALTRGGEASVLLGLDVPAATVLLSAEYRVSGTAPTCASPGPERVHTSAVVLASWAPAPMTKRPLTGAL